MDLAPDRAGKVRCRHRRRQCVERGTERRLRRGIEDIGAAAGIIGTAAGVAEAIQAAADAASAQESRSLVESYEPTRAVFIVSWKA